MILKEIRLKNIRSYTDENIVFSKGSTLLSGDIGSGKSTILLAIEFALFGLMRGLFSGETILRTGKNEGIVELTFSAANDVVTIRRGLKKQRDSITQTSGHITINGEKTELTPVELKAKIFGILGYPKDMLTKSKGLVYRYTVYTPQEEMKQIITDDKESRLDILRKVFGIEKYKKIRENSVIVMRNIKERIKEMEGKIYDLADKKQEIAEKNKQKEAIERNILPLRSRYETEKNLAGTRKEELKKIEEDIIKLNNLKKELEINENTLISVIEQRTRNLKEIDELEKEVLTLSKETSDKDAADPAKIRENIESEKKSFEDARKKILLLERKAAELGKECELYNAIKSKVEKIDKCPTCEQVVTEEHKKGIASRENKKIEEITIKIWEIKKDLAAKNSSCEELNKRMETLQKQLSEINVLVLKQKSMKDKNNKIRILSDENSGLKNRIGEINKKKIEAKTEIEKLLPKEKEYLPLKKAYDEIIEKLHLTDKDISVLEKEAQGIQRILGMLEKEVNEKLAIKKELEKNRKILRWIEESFIRMVGNMERAVMRRIHGEFNALFQSWFKILIEDENLNVRLDEEFVPIVEQNGYEIDIGSLSGGEKTSCALTYRLALNKVINDVIDTIKTKDIIILDEPTDGFSTEQLDKVRDLLELINTQQIIIVSHESKIESYVENIVRIVKNDHVSEAIVSRSD